MEDLFDWVKLNTPQDASFAGDVTEFKIRRNTRSIVNPLAIKVELAILTSNKNNKVACRPCALFGLEGGKAHIMPERSIKKVILKNLEFKLL